MKKFNFSESEKAFQKAAEINSIQKLLRLADSVSSEKSSENSENRAAFAKRIEELRNEIKSLKDHHSDSPELFRAIPEKLSALKDRLDRLNKELDDRPDKEPDDSPGKDAALEDQISIERREHVNKRLNVRKGWLPLK